MAKIIGHEEPEAPVRPSAGPQGDGGEEQVRLPAEAAVLVVRNMVLFPGTILPVAIGREKSRRLLSEVLPREKVIVVVCQRNPQVDEPGVDDLYRVGTAAMVLKLLQMEEGNQSLIVHGMKRVRVEQWLASEPYFRARIAPLNDIPAGGTEAEALVMNARNAARRIIQLSPNVPEEAVVVLNNIDDAGALADFLATNVQMDNAVKQAMLEELDVASRLRRVGVELQHQLDVLELSGKIRDEVKANIEKGQREYFLQEQLKAIQKELGQADDKTMEIAQLREKLQAAGMPEAVGEEVFRQLDRLDKLPPIAPEYTVIRTYLDWMTELPWSKTTTDNLDVNRGRQVLDEDHYDLEKVKRRILEYLAVRKLAPESRGPILCFLGPPGVGKTSLGQSIARALGRKFIRMSLGGMRD